jgi:hypothetical protein
LLGTLKTVMLENLKRWLSTRHCIWVKNRCERVRQRLGILRPENCSYSL